jgi:hypothetical protein
MLCSMPRRMHGVFDRAISAQRVVCSAGSRPHSSDETIVLSSLAESHNKAQVGGCVRLESLGEMVRDKPKHIQR